MIFIATGSLRATWLPEGFEIYHYIFKISYESVVLCHLTVLASAFTTASCIHVFVHLFWWIRSIYFLWGEREHLSIRCLKSPAFCVEGRTFSVVNESFPMIWILPWKNAAGPACRRNNETASCTEGKRRRRYSSALFVLDTRFVLIYIFRSFRPSFSTEEVRRSLKFSIFSLVRCY